MLAGADVFAAAVNEVCRGQIDSTGNISPTRMTRAGNIEIFSLACSCTSNSADKNLKQTRHRAMMAASLSSSQNELSAINSRAELIAQHRRDS